MNGQYQRISENSAVYQPGRRGLVSRALDCFVEKGYFTTSFKELAHYLQLSEEETKAAFASKDVILSEYLTHCDDEILTQIKQATHPDGDALDHIRDTCLVTLSFLGRHEKLPAIWMEFYQYRVARVVLKQFFKQLRARITTQISAGMNSGSIRTADSTQLADSILVLFEGTLILSLLEASTNQIEQRFLASWEIMIEGLQQTSIE